MSQLDSIGVAKQSAFGTKQTTMEYFADVESATVGGTPTHIENQTTVGYYYPIPLDMGLQVWNVGLNLIPRAASFPRVLSGFFGGPTTTSITSGYQHAYDPVAASGLVYHSVLINRHDPVILSKSAITDLAYDCAGSQLTVSGKAGDFIKAVANYVGANNDSTQSEPSATLDATERFNWSQAKLYATINGGSESEIKVNAFEWLYDTKIETDHVVLGSTSLASIPRGLQESQLKFTLTEEDASEFLDWYRYALKTSSRDSIAFRLAVQGSLITGSYYTGFELKGYNGEVIDAPANVDAKSRLRQVEVTVRFNYDSTDSKFVDATAWNDVTSY